MHATCVPTATHTCASGSPTRSRRSTCGAPCSDDGAVLRGAASGRGAPRDEAADALRDAYGLRTCRPRLPVDDGSCMRGALGRCHAPCHGAPEAVAYAAAVRAARGLARRPWRGRRRGDPGTHRRARRANAASRRPHVSIAAAALSRASMSRSPRSAARERAAACSSLPTSTRTPCACSRFVTAGCSRRARCRAAAT